MNSRICLSYGHSQLDPPSSISPRTSWIEIRIDLLRGFTPSEPESLVAWCRELQDYFPNLIVTYRSTSPYFVSTPFQRLHTLRLLLAAGVQYVDVDLLDSELIDLGFLQDIQSANANLILSRHFFDSVPSLSHLTKCAEAMQQHSPWLVKLAVACDTLEQAMLLMDLYALPMRMLIFGMGAAASPSRLEALRHGAPFTYTSFKKTTAPGQLSPRQVEEFCLREGIKPFYHE